MPGRRVLPFGKSLLLGVVSESLQSCPDLDLLPPSPILTDQVAAEYRPDVVLFDLETGEPPSTLHLLESHPGLTFIGLGPSLDHMLVLTSRQQRAVAMSDLERVILTPLESESSDGPIETSPGSPPSETFHAMQLPETVRRPEIFPAPWLAVIAGVVLGGVTTALWYRHK